ncbi:hypothetical protein UZ965_24920 [Escherichia coli]|nr:hypothetical protein [Escherichia coli]MDY9298385.1 hypothetical protein [Escherichia coli]MDY9360602.1 hypothetical protein [Escherichia coli]
MPDATLAASYQAYKVSRPVGRIRRSRRIRQQITRAVAATPGAPMPDATLAELNPKTWTVSVNRLFDTQSGILPG